MEESGPTVQASGTTLVTTPRQPALPINDISAEKARSKATGIGEFDRVLGGGIVPGAVILLAGEPGVGKSTLLLEVASTCAGAAPVLYITGEESASQVRGRAERIGALHPQLFLADETSLSTALGHIEATNPSLVIVDSVQTLQSDQLDGKGCCQRVDPRCQGTLHSDPFGWSCHQGWWDRGSSFVRAPCRRGLPIRGGPSHAVEAVAGR